MGIHPAILRRRSGGVSYAAGGQSPALVADMDRGYFRAPARVLFADLFTHSRASTATYVDSTGTLQTAGSGVARTDHHVYEGGEWKKRLLIEADAAENLLHTTDTLVTQSVTVTAQPYTLHFTGTGTITLSGAHVDFLVGTGAGENNRVSLSFTPSAGTLTLTVTGAVTDAQLEAGSIVSSYTPNLAGSGTATRAAETLAIPAATITAALGGSMPAAFCVAMDGNVTFVDDNSTENIRFFFWRVDNDNFVYFDIDTNVGESRLQLVQKSAGAIEVIVSGDAPFPQGVNTPFSVASRHGATFVNGAYDGTALTADETPTTLADLTSVDFQIAFNGIVCIKSIRIWAVDIGDDGIAEASA